MARSSFYLSSLIRPFNMTIFNFLLVSAHFMRILLMWLYNLSYSRALSVDLNSLNMTNFTDFSTSNSDLIIKAICLTGIITSSDFFLKFLQILSMIASKLVNSSSVNVSSLNFILVVSIVWLYKCTKKSFESLSTENINISQPNAKKNIKSNKTSYLLVERSSN